MRLISCLLAALLAAHTLHAAGAAPELPSVDDFALAVTMSANDQGGTASATIRIHASPAVLWEVLTSCPEAVQIVPGLRQCVVEETAPDHSWQRIHQIMDYSWYLPRVSYEIRATYRMPNSITFEKVAGDLLRLRGSWEVRGDGEYSIASYNVEFEPGIWVPRWFVRSALKRDLPKMLRALRDHAEAAHQPRAG